MLVICRLRDFRCKFEIIQQFFLSDIQEMDFDVFPCIRAFNQQLQRAQQGFQFLKLRGMNNGIHLPAGSGINISNHGVNGQDIDRFSATVAL